MPWEKVSHAILGRELKLLSTRAHRHGYLWEVEKLRSPFEICSKCATPCHRRSGVCFITVREEPLWGKPLWLRIKKHRYYCPKCKKPFTEPVQGVLPRRRTTQRFRKSIMQACLDYSNLSRVRRKFFCSSALVYEVLYQQLDIKLRERKGAHWPSKLGIDEHFFSRRHGYAEFVTVFADLRKGKLFEIAKGKDKKSLIEQLSEIPGREDVQEVVIDLSNGFLSFVRAFFPNARITADKFHALRLITPQLLKTRKEIVGHRQDLRTRKLLLRSRIELDYDARCEIDRYLKSHPKLQELYWCKEKLFELYRTKGIERASKALQNLLRRLEESRLEEVHRLKRTLTTWRSAILNYFTTGLTNGLTEAINGTAKLVQRRAYGYKSFRNYRLRTLSACS